MKQFALLSMLLSSNAFAVAVIDCPKAVSVQIANPRMSKTLGGILKDLGHGKIGVLEEREEIAIAQTVKNIGYTQILNRTFALSDARNGRCVYRGRGEEKIEIFSTRGRPFIYLQTSIGPRGILLRTYGQISAMNPFRISLSNPSGMMALAIPRYPYTRYSAGGPLLNVGVMGSFRVAVLR